MDDNEQKSRAAIAEQAAERFVANDDGPLDERDSAALLAWLKASPAHIEAFLGVSAIARDLPELRSDPEYSVEAILERGRQRGRNHGSVSVAASQRRCRESLPGHWPLAAAAMAVFAVVCVGLFLIVEPEIRRARVAFRRQRRHCTLRRGTAEQRAWRLADNSMLHLNTDSAVTIRYGKTERLVMLTSGQADFEVAHEPDRAFRVFAGAAEVIAIGTKFDVRLEDDATVVTMVEGRVAVGPSPMSGKRGADSSEQPPPRFVELGADQQITPGRRGVAAEVTAVDAQRDTAWLRQQIVFDHEPLERSLPNSIATRQKPIEITTPALRNLQISGAFATDDIDAFIAFLRSLKGVRVEVTATQIRVSGE